MNWYTTCQKADQQTNGGGHKNGERPVPQIRHLVDRHVSGPAASTISATQKSTKIMQILTFLLKSKMVQAK